MRGQDGSPNPAIYGPPVPVNYEDDELLSDSEQSSDDEDDIMADIDDLVDHIRPQQNDDSGDDPDFELEDEQP
jgi:hypothetical protein